MNREIRANEVLLIDDQNVKQGVVPTRQALQLAEERELDLVEVAPLAKPPVCRIMDYGKYRFQQQKRDKDARKKQKNQSVKEMKMRPKIDVHDYTFKVKAVCAFLEDGHRVKVSVFFRGREMAFLDRGREVLDRVVEGKLNKQIADELSISMKTVEAHRARVMEKMGVRSLAELVQCALESSQAER